MSYNGQIVQIYNINCSTKNNYFFTPTNINGCFQNENQVTVSAPPGFDSTKTIKVLTHGFSDKVKDNDKNLFVDGENLNYIFFEALHKYFIMDHF